MKSSPSNTSKLNWNSSVDQLFPRRVPKAVGKLAEAGTTTLEDCLWIVPLRFHPIPSVASFDEIVIGEVFKGIGQVISFNARPNFRAYGKGRVRLQNMTIVLKDHFGDGHVELKWFNSYPSHVNKFRNIGHITFSGECKEVRGGKIQFINPDMEEFTDDDVTSELTSKDPEYKIQYPTINGVGTRDIKNIIGKIPEHLWDSISDSVPDEILCARGLMPLGEAFQTVHGKARYSKDLFERAKERLIYEEFLQEQIKLLCRRNNIKSQEAVVLDSGPRPMQTIRSIFPYELTGDQEKVIGEVLEDMGSGHPMMRLVQGDVGCGKTSVALSAAYTTTSAGFQVAIMCPTESLALQHFETFNQFLGEHCNIEILLGSTTARGKKDILERTSVGDIDILVGTHSLIQDGVEFRELALTVIDEQHKFGVAQRIRLTEKSIGGHCLIMTATPIPRSLSLTQYGDLSLSVIKTMPSGRKGVQTRIVMPDKFNLFLNFIKTRLQLGEQVYVVVPAIKESEKQDLLNLEDVFDRFSNLFPNSNVSYLHGQMKADEKSEVLGEFKRGEIDILISTSVIEVGIDIHNATVMAVLNPDRFGLSSLHQMRGRVGRGDKKGFFFLVNDKRISLPSYNRIKILEDTDDGFVISEEDLKIRGRGDLFGTYQSGVESHKRISNIVEHQNYLMYARDDIDKLVKSEHPYIHNMINYYDNDSTVVKTI